MSRIKIFQTIFIVFISTFIISVCCAHDLSKFEKINKKFSPGKNEFLVCQNLVCQKGAKKCSNRLTMNKLNKYQFRRKDYKYPQIVRLHIKEK